MTTIQNTTQIYNKVTISINNNQKYYSKQKCHVYFTFTEIEAEDNKSTIGRKKNTRFDFDPRFELYDHYYQKIRSLLLVPLLCNPKIPSYKGLYKQTKYI